MRPPVTSGRRSWPRPGRSRRSAGPGAGAERRPRRDHVVDQDSVAGGGRAGAPGAGRPGAPLAAGRPAACPASAAGRARSGSPFDASAAAIASAASNPRQRRRTGAGGTGTITPSSRPAGARSAISPPARLASAQPDAELECRHQVPGHALIGRGRPGGVQPRDRRRARCEPTQPGLAPARTAARRRPHSRAHRAQRGGTTRPRSSASIGYDRRPRPRVLGAHTARISPHASAASSRRPPARPPRPPPRSRSPPAPCRAPCRGPSGRGR